MQVGQQEMSKDVEDEEKGGELEPWHVWAQRVTHLAVDEMRRAEVEDWGEAVRRKIWVLAGHISRRDDERWSTKMLEWQPERGIRKVGHPDKRWSDDLDRKRGARRVENSRRRSG